MENKELQVYKDQLVLLVLQVVLDYQVQLAKRVIQVALAHRVYRVHLLA
jgi:hypothetical protein